MKFVGFVKIIIASTFCQIMFAYFCPVMLGSFLILKKISVSAFLCKDNFEIFCQRMSACIKRFYYIISSCCWLVVGCFCFLLLFCSVCLFFFYVYFSAFLSSNFCASLKPGRCQL